jgi:hypothetical protein
MRKEIAPEAILAEKGKESYLLLTGMSLSG